MKPSLTSLMAMLTALVLPAWLAPRESWLFLGATAVVVFFTTLDWGLRDRRYALFVTGLILCGAIGRLAVAAYRSGTLPSLRWEIIAALLFSTAPVPILLQLLAGRFGWDMTDATRVRSRTQAVRFKE